VAADVLAAVFAAAPPLTLAPIEISSAAIVENSIRCESIRSPQVLLGEQAGSRDVKKRRAEKYAGRGWLKINQVQFVTAKPERRQCLQTAAHGFMQRDIRSRFRCENNRVHQHDKL
jgi:hypothetical protein